MINVIPSNHANTIMPYIPLGRQVVGEENTDLKISTVKAVEQTTESVRNENRRIPERKIDQTDTDDTQSRRQAAKKEQLIQDQAKISSLSARDRDVRAHEQAHAAVGGQYAGSPTYQFVKGPDGVNYAVAGEVSISTGAVPNDPEATIKKAQRVRAAANAPADPSGQDRSVAAAAANLEANARAELNAKQNAEIQEKEKLAEQKIKQQKAEEAKKNLEDKQLSEENKQLSLKQEEALVRKSAERIDGFQKTNKKTFDITRHLVQIGAVKGLESQGGFLNQRV